MTSSVRRGLATSLVSTLADTVRLLFVVLHVVKWSWICISALPRTSTSRSVRSPRSSASTSSATSCSSSSRRAPGGGHDHAHDAAVLGIGPALDQAVVGQLVEVAHQGGRLDAHAARELALAGAVGGHRLPQQHPVPEAGAVLAQPGVEHVGDGAWPR